MYWYSDDRSIEFNFDRQKTGRNRAFYGPWSSPVFLTDILKYRLDRQLKKSRRDISLSTTMLCNFLDLRPGGSGSFISGTRRKKLFGSFSTGLIEAASVT